MHLFEAKLFKEIAQTRSISKAAVHNGISQSAATQHVQELERRLGLRLVDRSTRPLALTDAGKIYADFCREVLRREELFLVAKPDAAIPILDTLKLELDFDYLVDVTAVDYPKRTERFDLVYILYSFARNERMRVKAMIPDGYTPATAVTVHLAANWLEREVFDMFGIQFAGHPNMRRILLPEEWQGYPLRKEYGILQQDDGWVRENLGIESGQ